MSTLFASQDTDAIEGMMHVMLGSQGVHGNDSGKVVMFHGGERYGGFSSIDHALFMVRKRKWRGAIINVYANAPSEEDCRRPIMESREGLTVLITA